MNKKCVYCHKELPDSAKFCGYCGKGFEDNYVATDIESTGTVQKKESAQVKATVDSNKIQVRPWIRFWARQFDYALFGIVFAIGSAFIYPSILRMPQYGFGLLIVFIWVFVEAFLLSTWGTTPGKWLCRTIVRDRNDKKVIYATALGRSFNVWIRGVGLGIPIVCIFTQVSAYNKLNANGKTTWDTEGEFKVTHKKIGFIRAFFMILLLIAYYVLTYYPKE